MKLLQSPKQNNDISFTEKDAIAILNCDFSDQIIDNDDDYIQQNVSRKKIPSWMMYVAGAIAFGVVIVVLFQLMKNRSTKKNNMNTNKKSTSYAKLGLDI